MGDGSSKRQKNRPPVFPFLVFQVVLVLSVLKPNF